LQRSGRSRPNNTGHDIFLVGLGQKVKRKNWHSDVLTSGGRGIRQRLQPMLKSPAAGFAQIWSRYAAIGSRYGGRPAAIKRGVIIFPVKPAYRNRICPSRDRHPIDRRLSMRAFAGPSSIGSSSLSTRTTYTGSVPPATRTGHACIRFLLATFALAIRDVAQDQPPQTLRRSNADLRSRLESHI